MSTDHDQKRHPKGAPASIGGQWARDDHRAASDVVIHADSDDEREQQELQRAKAIAEGIGYLPAATQSSKTTVRSTEGIDRWWDQTRQVAEFAPDGTAFPMMPDDYGATRDGRSLDNERRQPRMLYKASDGSVALRMPSAARVRRYAAEVGPGRPFDIPVEAEVDGRTVIGFVRVTHHGDGIYTTVPMNFPPAMSATVGESTAAVLEARRVRTALDDIQTIQRRHNDRVGQAGIEVKPVVVSSFITGAGYNRSSGEAVIEITGKNGDVRRYAYRDVDQESWARFKQAASPGRAYQEYIKYLNGVARGSHKVAQCEQCMSVYRDDTRHRCLVRRAAKGQKPVLHDDQMRVLELQFRRAQRRLIRGEL